MICMTSGLLGVYIASGGVPRTCVVSGILGTCLVTKVPSSDWPDLYEEKKNLSPGRDLS